MPTVTYTANVLFARRYGSSSNMISDAASQGATSLGQIVGVINFRTMDMTNKVITGITFKTTCTSSAGAGNGSTKTLYFKQCAKADPTTSTTGNGSTFVGTALGSISGTNFYNASNITRVVDTGTSLFTNLKAFLEGGGHSFALYAPDSVPSSGYSTNYLYLDGLAIVIDYVEGLVYFGTGDAWVKCLVYTVVDGVWVQCIPYYGSGGLWNQTGG